MTDQRTIGPGAAPAGMHWVHWAHWERGYRVHGLWENGTNTRIARIGMSPPNVVDCVYHWSIDRTDTQGVEYSLNDAKDQVRWALRDRADLEARRLW